MKNNERRTKNDNDSDGDSAAVPVSQNGEGSDGVAAQRE